MRGYAVVFSATSATGVERLERLARSQPPRAPGKRLTSRCTRGAGREATVRGSVSQAIRIGEAAASRRAARWRP